MPNNNPLLKEARKYIPDCDWIVDLYDLSFQWASGHALKLTGYSLEDVKKMQSLELPDPSYSRTQLRRDLLSRIGKGHGEFSYNILAKNGTTLSFKGRYHVFTYEGTWYLVGKILKMKPAGNNKKEPLKGKSPHD